MRVDRRGFIRIGGASALTALGCNLGGPSESRNESARAPGRSVPSVTPGQLEIAFTGLVFLEKLAPNAAVVHVVNGEALSVGPHVPRLWVPASAIDQTVTPKPDASLIQQIGGTQFWLWDLNGVNVTTPAPPGGQPDLSFDETPVGANTKPADDAGWKSLQWMPDLKVLTGATKIVNRAPFISAITLNHGRVESGKPSSDVGQRTVWRFTNPAGQVIMRRALTDKIVYTCPTEGKVSIGVGDQTIVLQPIAGVPLEVRNLPPDPPPGTEAKPCPDPCNPNINHFVAFFSLVDAQYTPTAALDSFDRPPKEGLVLPDYCPPPQI